MASERIRISIKWELTGWQVDWTIKQSEPRTDSSREMEISPSLKVETLHFPKGNPRFSAIYRANSGFALPEKILISLPCRFMIHTPFCKSRRRHRPLQFWKTSISIMTAKSRIYKIRRKIFVLHGNEKKFFCSTSRISIKEL